MAMKESNADFNVKYVVYQMARLQKMLLTYKEEVDRMNNTSFSMQSCHNNIQSELRKLKKHSKMVMAR